MEGSKPKGFSAKLYHWTLDWAGTRYAMLALLFVSFFNSTFFPIPPDVLLLAMCFQNPQQWFRYATWCTLTSVLGGILGWYVGYALFESVGKFLLAQGYENAFVAIERELQRNAFLYLLVSGVTPIPFKVISIACGVFSDAVPLGLFIVATAIRRGLKYYVTAALVWKLGPKARPFIEKHLNTIMILSILSLVFGFLLLKLLK